VAVVGGGDGGGGDDDGGGGIGGDHVGVGGAGAGGGGRHVIVVMAVEDPGACERASVRKKNEARIHLQSRTALAWQFAQPYMFSLHTHLPPSQRPVMEMQSLRSCQQLPAMMPHSALCVQLCDRWVVGRLAQSTGIEVSSECDDDTQ